jgi:glutaredoxin
MKCRVLACALFLAATAAAAQQVYRWTDEKGRVHVTDTPPPPGAKGVRPLGPAGRAASTPQAGGSEPYAVQIARKNYPVTLYSTPGCEACSEARKLLNERGVPFTENSVNNEKQLEELKAAVGSNSVPSLVVGGTVQKGFEEAVYHRVLDAAGYPKTGMVPPRTQTEPQPLQPQTEVKPLPDEALPGPYAPGAPPQRAQKK